MDLGDQVVEMVARDRTAWRAAAALREAGGEVYAVGGVVRDVALGVEPNDVDLLIRKLTREQVRETLERLPGRVSEVGKSFGIIEYRSGSGCVQVALPRKDRFIGVHHTDVDVQVDPWMSVVDDLRRRDYTVNAVAVAIPSGIVIDPLHGLIDARYSKLRAVSMEVLADDPLRVLRGIVLSAKRDLVLELQTFRMLCENAQHVKHLPADRIHDELDKLMQTDSPAKAIRAAQTIGVLEVILPEVSAMHGYDQRSRYHKHNLFDHTMLVLEVASLLTDDVDVRYAALLHDVGKPDSAWEDDDGYRHYYERRHTDDDTADVTIIGADHEVLGAQMVHDLLTRLRYSAARRTRIVALVRHHMFAYFDSPRGARRFLARVGDEHADDLITLRRADDEGKDEPRNDRMRDLIDHVRQANDAFSVRDLEINGHDLIALGVPAGPVRGHILTSCLDYVVDDPPMNERGTLLRLVESLYEDWLSGESRQGAAST